jgi:hypothetical protein
MSISWRAITGASVSLPVGMVMFLLFAETVIGGYHGRLVWW